MISTKSDARTQIQREKGVRLVMGYTGLDMPALQDPGRNLILLDVHYKTAESFFFFPNAKIESTVINDYLCFCVGNKMERRNEDG